MTKVVKFWQKRQAVLHRLAQQRAAAGGQTSEELIAEAEDELV
jgi:hypothetical protein